MRNGDEDNEEHYPVKHVDYDKGKNQSKEEGPLGWPATINKEDFKKLVLIHIQQENVKTIK